MFALFQQCINLLFPVTCLGCDHEDKWLCDECKRSIPLYDNARCPLCFTTSENGSVCLQCRKTSNLDSLWVVCSYEHALVRELIHTLKYQAVTHIADNITEIIKQSIAKLKKNSDIQLPQIIIPIPLHRKKMLERGFNQSDILAQIVSSCLDGEYHSGGLVRIRNTVPQAGLSKSDRTSNLTGAFNVSPKLAISGKHVMLVDDVATTCATMESAAIVLRKHGARSVRGISFARGKMT